MSIERSRPEQLVMPQGGVLPAGVLDPSILCLEPDPGPDRQTVSSTGSLAESSAVFWAAYTNRYFGPINSFFRGGEIPRHHEEFLSDNLDIFELEMIDEEALESLEEFDVFLKEPGQKSFGFEEYAILKQIAPQFFLRNVNRMEKETNLPYVPFEIHLYRDPEEYAVVPLSGIEFVPASSEMLEVWSSRTIGEQRLAIRQLVELLDWAEYEDGWTEGREEWVEGRLKFFRTTRHKGRFATKADLAKEADEAEGQDTADPYANLSPEIRQSLGLD